MREQSRGKGCTPVLLNIPLIVKLLPCPADLRACSTQKPLSVGVTPAVIVISLGKDLNAEGLFVDIVQGAAAGRYRGGRFLRER